LRMAIHPAYFDINWYLGERIQCKAEEGITLNS
jgi:hypothetical protein